MITLLSTILRLFYKPRSKYSRLILWIVGPILVLTAIVVAILTIVGLCNLFIALLDLLIGIIICVIKETREIVVYIHKSGKHTPVKRQGAAAVLQVQMVLRVVAV